MRHLPRRDGLDAGAIRSRRRRAWQLRDLPRRHEGDRQGSEPHHDDASCDACHSTVAWTPAQFDHANVAPGTCISCHDGTQATGKNPQHIRTTNTCDACHTRRPGSRRCASTTPRCSAAARAATTAPRRPASRRPHPDHAACDTCHVVTAWTPARFDHAGVAPGSCASCHNGTKATGKIASTSRRRRAAIPATDRRLDAGAVRPRQRRAGHLLQCHNGTQATGKNAQHIRTTNTCDPATARRPGSRRCASTMPRCSAPARAATTAPRRPASRRTTSRPRSMRHLPHRDRLDAGALRSHRRHARHLRELPQRHQATGKTANHIATTASCDACHTTTPGRRRSSTTPTSRRGPAPAATTARRRPARTRSTSARRIPAIPATARRPGARRRVDHTEVLGTCASCHNGTNATGKPANHIPTTQHATTATSRRPGRRRASTTPVSRRHLLELPQRHAARPASPTTSRPRRAATPATRPSPGRRRVRPCQCHAGHLRPVPQRHQGHRQDAQHIRTTNTCEACHSTTAWSPAMRVDHTDVHGTCASCHNGTTATGKPPTHIPTTLDCDDCHTDRLDAGALRPHRRHAGHLRDLPQRHAGDRQAGDPHRDDRELRRLPLDPAWTPAHFDHATSRGHLRAVPQRHARDRQARGSLADDADVRRLPPDDGLDTGDPSACVA